MVHNPAIQLLAYYLDFFLTPGRNWYGGAHRDHHIMATQLKMHLRNYIRELVSLPVDELVEQRYQKFRRMGVFEEGQAAIDQ